MQFWLTAWKAACNWNIRTLTLADVLQKNIFLADITVTDGWNISTAFPHAIPEVNLLSTMLREDRSTVGEVWSPTEYE